MTGEKSYLTTTSSTNRLTNIYCQIILNLEKNLNSVVGSSYLNSGLVESTNVISLFPLHGPMRMIFSDGGGALSCFFPF